MKDLELASAISFASDKGEFVLKKRIELLRQIDKTGSILQASKNVPLSYKAAWDALDMMNNISPKPVIKKTAGGKRGGGSTLTEYGKNLIKIYDALEMAQAKFLAILEENINAESGEIENLQRIAMQISARNVFVGEISNLEISGVSAVVSLRLRGEQTITSVITKDSAQNLGLKVGKMAKAIIKASSVMLAKDELNLSARNIIKGEILEINLGEINSEVSLDIGGEQVLTATVTSASVKSLGLKVGESAFGIIKSSSVMIGL